MNQFHSSLTSALVLDTEEQLASLKKHSAASKGFATWRANKVRRFLPTDLHELDWELLSQQFDALAKADELYYNIHLTIVSNFAWSINEGEEQANLEPHNSIVQATTSQLRKHSFNYRRHMLRPRIYNRT